MDKEQPAFKIYDRISRKIAAHIAGNALNNKRPAFLRAFHSIRQRQIRTSHPDRA